MNLQLIKRMLDWYNYSIYGLANKYFFSLTCWLWTKFIAFAWMLGEIWVLTNGDVERLGLKFWFPLGWISEYWKSWGDTGDLDFSPE